jgi:glutamate synthase domain-containing protein 1
MNNNPSIRIITVHEIETYNKIIILKKTDTFIVLFIITGRPTSFIQQELYKMYLFNKMIILKAMLLANQTANYI